MPNILINIPDCWLPWIELRRHQMALRSRAAALKWAIRKACGIPDDPNVIIKDDPGVEDVSLANDYLTQRARSFK